MYKSASQHRRALHFQRMRGVTRRLREVAALDVGGAAAALRAGLDAGVSEDARAAALASPAVAAGRARHMETSLPSALGRPLAPPPRRRARRRGDGRGATRRGHVPQRPTRAHLLHALRARRRRVHRATAHVPPSTHRGRRLDLQHPHAAPRRRKHATPGPPRRLCRRRPRARIAAMRMVNRDPPRRPRPAQTRHERTPRGKARRPKVRVVEFETNAVGGIHDEDWNWRLLRRAPASGAATTAATANAKTTRFDGAGGEDLGAAVPRSVRGLEAKIDKGENEGGRERNPPRRRTRGVRSVWGSASRRATRSR